MARPPTQNSPLGRQSLKAILSLKILQDGASIHMWDDHFQFGRRKAEMLVACIDVLRDFWRSNGDEDGIFMPRVIENQGRRLRIRTHGAVTFCLAGNRVSWLGFQTNPSRLQSLPLVCDAKESAVLKDSFLSAASRKRTSLATISV